MVDLAILQKKNCPFLRRSKEHNNENRLLQMVLSKKIQTPDQAPEGNLANSYERVAAEILGTFSRQATMITTTTLTTSPRTNHDDDHDDDNRQAHSRALSQYHVKLSRRKFPIKLMVLLEDDNYSNIISWTYDSTIMFTIHKPEEFTKQVLPQYFKQSKFSSFLRKMYRWGFSRRLESCINTPKGSHTFSHPQFIRGNFTLCEEITTCSTGKKVKNDSSYERENNVDTMRNDDSTALDGRVGASTSGDGLVNHHGLFLIQHASKNSFGDEILWHDLPSSGAPRTAMYSSQHRSTSLWDEMISSSSHLVSSYDNVIYHRNLGQLRPRSMLEFSSFETMNRMHQHQEQHQQHHPPSSSWARTRTSSSMNQHPQSIPQNTWYLQPSDWNVASSARNRADNPFLTRTQRTTRTQIPAATRLTMTLNDLGHNYHALTSINNTAGGTTQQPQRCSYSTITNSITTSSRRASTNTGLVGGEYSIMKFTSSSPGTQHHCCKRRKYYTKNYSNNLNANNIKHHQFAPYHSRRIPMSSSLSSSGAPAVTMNDTPTYVYGSTSSSTSNCIQSPPPSSYLSQNFPWM